MLIPDRRMRMGALLAFAPVVPLLLWATLRGEADPPEIRLVVNVAARRLSVVEDERVVKRYSIAVGRPSHPTPRGRFRTGRIVWNPRWIPPKVPWARGERPQPPGDPDNPMQGVKIYFKAPDYYIHGTNDPESIGTAASHGCIRMTPRDAKDLARRIQRAGGNVPLRISTAAQLRPPDGVRAEVGPSGTTNGQLAEVRPSAPRAQVCRGPALIFVNAPLTFAGRLTGATRLPLPICR